VIGNDAIVFDGVAHVFNFEKKNALGPAGEMVTIQVPVARGRVGGSAARR
jgi:hypothetical protein